MKKEINLLATILTLITLTISKSNGQDKLSIDSFTTFPPEIAGCSCYFSSDSIDFKNKKYIYANDFAQTSFLKINGVMTKFKQTDFEQFDNGNTFAKYKGDGYEMILEVKDGKQNGDETWFRTGTIKLIDKKRKTLTKKFYGECGC